MLRYLEEHKVIMVYIPLVVYWLVLLGATSFPVDYIPAVGIGDKFEHLFAYMGLTVLLNLTIVFQNKFILLKKKNTLFTFIISGLYGALDEVHQYFIPGRSCELFDWIADLLGILLGLFLINFIIKQ